MDKNIRLGYITERTTGTRACDALRTARYNLKKQKADIPRYVGDDIRIDLPRGEYIVMCLENDDDADITERLDCNIGETVSDDVRNNASEGWQDRNGRVVIDIDQRGYRRDWQYLESGYPLSQRIAHYRKQGMSRHLAWLAARKSIDRDADYFRKTRDDGYVGFITTLHAADGSEIDSESCWGFEYSDDAAGMEALSHAEYMMHERAEYWKIECASAKNVAAKHLAEHRAILKEFRETAQLPDVLQGAIYGKLAEIRAAHKAAIRILTGE